MTTPPTQVFRGRILADGVIRPGTVIVRDGTVLAVAGPHTPVPDGAAVIEVAADEVLLPGLVDTHVHLNEPGRTEWEGFASGTRAALAGGVTTLLDMPLNAVPPTTSVTALDCKRRAARGQERVDIGFWGGAVPDSLGRLAELWEAGVFGFKCFLLESGVPEFPPLDATQLHRAMTEIATFDGLLIVHAEDPAVIGAHPGGAMPTYAQFLASRPPAAETQAIRTVIDAAAATGCRTHIVHLAAAEAVPDLAEARAAGIPLTAETCPHYLTVAAEEIGDGQTQYKCCPPIRNSANRALLWEALIEGVIDFVVSDHSPSTVELKRLDSGDFAQAWGGISSLQLGLSLMTTAATAYGVTLPQVVNWMAARPAAIVGVPRKGAIAPGYDADFAVFAPEETVVVDARALQHRNPLTPYQGRTLTGVVRRTFLRGEHVGPDDPARGAQLVRK